ncbi:MAG: hypothetical protein HXX17_11485 [Geobacteraceae bacterium]|nr:hypothetical protein [Geobacteraceae bacterium]
MSSILKALKKLEDEKIAQHEESKRHVSGEILKPQVEKGVNARWLWLLAGASAVVILLLIVALLRKAPSDTTSIKTPPLAAPELSPTPAAMEPLTVKAAEGAPKTTNHLISPVPAKPLNSQTVQTPPPPHNLPGPAEPELPGFKAPEPPRVEAPAPKSLNASAEPALTLNGIAWNRDSADRLAIINGQPARVGEIVAGAVVVEVLQDRARLTRNGKSIELSIGKSSAKE